VWQREYELEKNGSMRKSILVYSAATALIALILLAGAVYQFLEARADMAQHPAPGRLVDIGGYRLHLNCEGLGAPTVLLESGIADDSLTWAGVQPSLAKVTRVCSYDRAGYGWSDPSPKPRDVKTIAQELHTLLTNAGVGGPFVLVGHSLGGMVVREYAGLYRSDVVGMVLVDSTSPDQYRRMDAAISRGNEQFLRRLGYLEDTMPFGWPRISGWCDHWPAAERDVRRATECRLQPWRTHMAEWRAFDEDSTEVLEGGPVGDIPLTVMTEGSATTNAPPNSFVAIQKELLRLSPQGKQIFVAGGHMIQVDHPQAVISAVLGVVAEVRNDPRNN
jgi:pimeloyl-ACP methyl ester carboxylesterase